MAWSTAGRAYVRLRARPLGAGLAMLIFLSGLYGVLGIGLAADVLATFLPTWALRVMSVTYMLSGLALVVGMASSWVNVEAAGCIGLATGILGRAIAIVAAFGLTLAAVATVAVYVVVAAACFERLRQIARGEQPLILPVPSVTTITKAER